MPFDGVLMNYKVDSFLKNGAHDKSLSYNLHLSNYCSAKHWMESNTVDQPLSFSTQNKQASFISLSDLQPYSIHTDSSSTADLSRFL